MPTIEEQVESIIKEKGPLVRNTYNGFQWATAKDMTKILVTAGLMQGHAIFDKVFNPKIHINSDQVVEGRMIALLARSGCSDKNYPELFECVYHNTTHENLDKLDKLVRSVDSKTFMKISADTVKAFEEILRFDKNGELRGKSENTSTPPGLTS